MVDNNIALIALIVFKIFFIFLSIYLTNINVMKFIAKHKIPSANLLWQAIGITGVIACFCMF